VVEWGAEGIASSPEPVRSRQRLAMTFSGSLSRGPLRSHFK